MTLGKAAPRDQRTLPVEDQDFQVDAAVAQHLRRHAAGARGDDLAQRESFLTGELEAFGAGRPAPTQRPLIRHPTAYIADTGAGRGAQS